MKRRLWSVSLPDRYVEVSEREDGSFEVYAKWSRSEILSERGVAGPFEMTSIHSTHASAHDTAHSLLDKKR